MKSEVKLFLDEFLGILKELQRKNLISFIVFGSALTERWEKGVSDIDMIIIIKEKIFAKETIAILKMLDRKYKFNLYQEPNNLFERIIFKFLTDIGFKESLFVGTESQLKSDFIFCKHKLLASLFIPKGLLFRNIKKNYKIFYGKDIFEREYPITVFDKLKAASPSICACLFAFLVRLSNKEKATNLSRTGVKWMNQNCNLKLEPTGSLWSNLFKVLLHHD